jgi:hypothetical protein
MNASNSCAPRALVLLAGAALLSGPAWVFAQPPSDEITAVSAKASPDYTRVRQKDGKYPVEGYAFGEGGHYGGPMIDPSIDKLKFVDVARVISVPLSEQNYWPDRDARSTKLLIMVYWGVTDVPPPISSSAAYNNLNSIQGQIATSGGAARAQAAGAGSIGKGYHSTSNVAGASPDQLDQLDSALAMLDVVNQQRTKTDFFNASMLGYSTEGMINSDYGNYVRGTALGLRREDLITEIEDNRYFVVLMAYDFQLMWKEKKHKLLWETRFSIRQRHNNFDDALAGMAKAASEYFGQNSGGLVRRDAPLGRVDIGDMKSLGTVEK